MAINGNYKNEYVEYKGQRVKVLEQNQAKRTLTIEYNGKTITVDYNDLFGINDNGNYIDEHIEFLDKQIEKRKKRIEFNSNLFSEALENIRKLHTEMRAFLDNHNVSSFKELKSKKDKDEYINMIYQSGNWKKAQRSASFWITTDANENLTDIGNRNIWESMQAIAT